VSTAPVLVEDDAPAGPGLLRNPADWRTLAFVGVYYVVSLSALVWPPEGWFSTLLMVIVVSNLSFFTATITHNAIHTPLFRSRTANKIFQHVLTNAYGSPVSAYVPGHNLSHHLHTQSRRDVMRTTKARFRWNFLNQLLFLPMVASSILRADFRFALAMRNERPRWFRQWASEWLVNLALQVLFIWINPLGWLLFIFIPHQYAAWGIVGMNFVQHDGCDQEHPYNHSRNLTGPIVNWLTFNNGYHGVHHAYPALHWTKLPEVHAAELAPHVHPSLDQNNFLAYCWRAYVWPGRRLKYDGTPFVLPEEGPDEEWIPGRGDTPVSVSLGAEG
jgi:fatty acid desaturase